MKRLKLGAVGGLVAALSMTLAACGSGAGAAAATHSTTSLTLNSYVQFQPNWWFPVDPASACSTGNSEASNMMYLPLLHISKTDSINYARSIASGITVSNNDTVYRDSPFISNHTGFTDLVVVTTRVWGPVATALFHADGKPPMPDAQYTHGDEGWLAPISTCQDTRASSAVTGAPLDQCHLGFM